MSKHIPRIYQPVALVTGASITLDDQAAHHLIHVLRLKVNEPLYVFNGDGGFYHSSISSITKKNVLLNINDFVDQECESPLQLHLGQALVRGEKMDLIIQKAVELGVTEITPLITDYCNIKLDAERSEKRLQHWQNIIINACEQCGRNRIPKINSPQLFSTWIAPHVSDVKFILHPYATKNNLATITKPHSITIMIGPEGGFSEQEITLAHSHETHSLLLGPRILRTETASLAALSVLQHRFGDL